jgi:DUF1707 SHOCT-like domain
MTVNREMRASDQDREHVVEMLRTHYSEGRLNLEEFDERVARAYESKTLGDLLDLTSDLPGAAALGPEPAATPVAREQANRPARLPLAVWPLVPLLFGLLVASSFAWGGMAYHGHHHVGPFFPWPLLLILVIFLARGRRSYRNGPGAR